MILDEVDIIVKRYAKQNKKATKILWNDSQCQ